MMNSPKTEACEENGCENDDCVHCASLCWGANANCTPPTREELLAERRRLLAELERTRINSVILADVMEALEDPNRPEESPVDAARRLRDELATLRARGEP